MSTTSTAHDEARSARGEGVVQVLIMLAIGGAAGAASFTHVHIVAASHGQGGWLAWADAVVLELMSIASGLEIRHRHRCRRSVGFPVAVLVCAVALSLAAQVLDAEPSPIGWVAAALPALGFLVMVKIALGRAPAGTVGEAHRVPSPVRDDHQSRSYHSGASRTRTVIVPDELMPSRTAPVTRTNGDGNASALFDGMSQHTGQEWVVPTSSQQSSTLGPDGFAGVNLGMTAAEALATRKLDVMSTLAKPPSEPCLHADFHGSESPTVYLSTQHNAVVAIHAGPRVATPEGLRWGTTFAEFMRLYPNYQEERPYLFNAPVPGNPDVRYVVEVGRLEGEPLKVNNLILMSWPRGACLDWMFEPLSS